MWAGSFYVGWFLVLRIVLFLFLLFLLFLLLLSVFSLPSATNLPRFPWHVAAARRAAADMVRRTAGCIDLRSLGTPIAALTSTTVESRDSCAGGHGQIHHARQTAGTREDPPHH